MELFQVLQYKQRCAELEAHLSETAYSDQPVPRPALTHHVSLPPTSALEQAQQHLREMRSEKISDLDTALLRLEEERQRQGIVVEKSCVCNCCLFCS